MCFRHITLTVKDLEASIDFYTNIVGLHLDSRYPAGAGTEIAFLGAGATKVELICYGKPQEEPLGMGVSIGFEVEDVPQKLESLKAAGIPILSEIIQPNPQIRFFFAADPDGFQVQFLEAL